MSFKELNIRDTYRSGEHGLLDDFYIPALSKAVTYDRAVGFFSTSLLIFALQGISKIISNNGKIRLIIGKTLTDEEYQAVKDGYEYSGITKVFEKELDDILAVESSIEKYRLRLFTAMIATGRLEIKFALRTSGMYHEKIGIMRDDDGNKLLFYGSANETTNAINSNLNYESFSVYKSWESDIYERFAAVYERGFENIWNGSEKGITTLKMPSKLYEKCHNYYMENHTNDIDLDDESNLFNDFVFSFNNHYPVIPKIINGKDFKLFHHQKEALSNWYANEKKGLLKLATGSGKTITALYGVSKMFEASKRPRRLFLLVAVPYVALAEQWVKELSLFNISPIKCFSNRKSWGSRLLAKINNLNSGAIEFASAVVVNKTLSSEYFKEIIKKIEPNNLFFIGDECHRHGSSNINNFLPDAYFRMGLSATPYTENYEESDEEEQTTKFRLTKYYGDIVASYSLHDALMDDVLTPYHYYLVPVELSVLETESYVEYSKEIGRLSALDNSSENSALKNMIRKRNKIISNASEKLSALDAILKSEKITDRSNTLFYVGEGKAGTDDDVDDFREHSDDDVSQLDEVAKIVSSNGWKVSSFTAKESTADRRTIMNSFTDGFIDGLVSMRVLDEGIDIPKCQRAFILASSRNSRQFVQRRGRILRKFEGKNLAHIYDFLVIPHKSFIHKSCSQLVAKELTRAMDFVVLSKNRSVSQIQAEKIGKDFGVDVMELRYE